MTTSTTTDIMRKLVAIRKGRELTTRHVAERMHVTVGCVCMIERRALDGRDIRLGTLIAYLRAIGVRLTYEVVDFDAELQRRSA